MIIKHLLNSYSEMYGKTIWVNPLSVVLHPAPLSWLLGLLTDPLLIDCNFCEFPSGPMNNERLNH